MGFYSFVMRNMCFRWYAKYTFGLCLQFLTQNFWNFLSNRGDKSVFYCS